MTHLTAWYRATVRWLRHPRIPLPSDDTWRLMSSGLALFAAIVVCYNLIQQQRQAVVINATSARSRCQVTYDHDFAVQANARTAAGDQDHDATFALITSVFSAKPGETQTQERDDLFRAYAAYQAAEKKITIERSAHQYPPLPSC